jgi:cytoskeletal protein CcmA (bactofilin family)
MRLPRASAPASQLVGVAAGNGLRYAAPAGVELLSKGPVACPSGQVNCGGVCCNPNSCLDGRCCPKGKCCDWASCWCCV